MYVIPRKHTHKITNQCWYLKRVFQHVIYVVIEKHKFPHNNILTKKLASKSKEMKEKKMLQDETSVGSVSYSVIYPNCMLRFGYVFANKTLSKKNIVKLFCFKKNSYKSISFWFKNTRKESFNKKKKLFTPRSSKWKLNVSWKTFVCDYVSCNDFIK